MNVVWEPIIAAILAITNFSIKTNPSAPTAAAVLEHAVEDADIVVHVDWKVTVADNYATFTKMPDDAVVKQVPELRDAVRGVILQAEGGRSMAKAMIGMDPVSDLSSVTAFLKVRPAGQEPEVLVVARGKFAADLPTKVARTAGGKESTIDGRAAATMPDGTTIGLAKSGVLIAGKGDWVTPRLKNAWKPAPRARGSAWATIATALDAKPFLLVASKPSADAIKSLTQQLGPSFGKDLVTGHDVAVLTATSTGLGWIYQAKDPAMAKRIKTASEGVIDLLRASHLAPRGMAQVVVAALPSYARTSKGIDAVLASKDKLMTAMWDLTGDGKFEAKVKLDGKVVTVTTKAKKISDVVPTSMFVTLGAIGFIAERSRSKPEPPAAPAPGTGKATKPATPGKPAKPLPPRSGGGLGAPVKPTK